MATPSSSDVTPRVRAVITGSIGVSIGFLSFHWVDRWWIRCRCRRVDHSAYCWGNVPNWFCVNSLLLNIIVLPSLSPSQLLGILSAAPLQTQLSLPLSVKNQMDDSSHQGLNKWMVCSCMQVCFRFRKQVLSMETILRIRQTKLFQTKFWKVWKAK